MIRCPVVLNGAPICWREMYKFNLGSRKAKRRPVPDVRGLGIGVPRPTITEDLTADRCCGSMLRIDDAINDTWGIIGPNWGRDLMRDRMPGRHLHDFRSSHNVSVLLGETFDADRPQYCRSRASFAPPSLPPELFRGESGALGQGGELRPHDRRMHFRCVRRA
jgi:hypothetical protein